MASKKFIEELKLVEDALKNEQGKEKLLRYLKPLLDDIVKKYSSHREASGIPREELTRSGVSHLDFALKEYKKSADEMLLNSKETFLFSTYFTWYIRQGIVEYLKENRKGA